MIDLAVSEAVVTIVGMAVTGVAGFLLGVAKSHSKREKARIEIEKATAREMIFQAYEDYVINGERLTVSRYDELLRVFEAYTILGGNGTAKKYMEKIKEIGPYLETE